MERPKERLDDLMEAEQLDFFYWKAYTGKVSRAEAHRQSTNRDPEYQQFLKTIRAGGEEGTRIVKEVAEARRYIKR